MEDSNLVKLKKLQARLVEVDSALQELENEYEGNQVTWDLLWPKMDAWHKKYRARRAAKKSMTPQMRIEGDKLADEFMQNSHIFLELLEKIEKLEREKTKLVTKIGKRSARHSIKERDRLHRKLAATKDSSKKPDVHKGFLDGVLRFFRLRP